MMPYIMMPIRMLAQSHFHGGAGYGSAHKPLPDLSCYCGLSTQSVIGILRLTPLKKIHGGYGARPDTLINTF